MQIQPGLHPLVEHQLDVLVTTPRERHHEHPGFPALLLLEALPVQSVLAVDLVTAALAVGTLLLIRLPQPERHPGAGVRGVWSDLVAGLHYVRGWTGLLILLVMGMLINFLLIPSSALLPLLVRRHFGGGALEFGWMESLFGVGVVVGGLFLSLWGGFKRKIVTAQTGLIGVGLAHIVLGLAPGSRFDLALGAVFAAGFMISINGTILAVLQTAVTPEMQGRVFTLVGSTAAAMSPLSLAVAGPLTEQFGVQFWYVFAGITGTGMGLIALMIPAVLAMEQGPAGSTSPLAETPLSADTGPTG